MVTSQDVPSPVLFGGTRLNGLVKWLMVDSPQNFIWSDVTLRDVIGEESADERYVVIRRTHGSRPEGAGQLRVRRRNSGGVPTVLSDSTEREHSQPEDQVEHPQPRTRATDQWVVHEFI